MPSAYKGLEGDDMRHNYLIAIGIMLFLMFLPYVYAQEFNTDTLLLKVGIKQGESLNRSVSITNSAQKTIDFMVDPGNLVGLAFDSTNFSLGSLGEKSLVITFSDQNKTQLPGVYIGEVIVTSKDGSTIVKKIPVIFEVETPEVLFDSNINLPSSSSIFNAGSNVVFDINIFNLQKIGLKNVNVDYSIKDFKGNVIVDQAENVAVESSVMVTKTFSLPSKMDEGDYVFTVTIRYASSVGTSTSSFSVTNQPVAGAGNNNILFIMMWIFGITLALIVGIVIYSNKKSDALLSELERQYKRETEKQIEVIQRLEEAELTGITGARERERKEGELAKLGQKRQAYLRVRYEKRKKELSELSSKGLKADIAKKLNKWKREGYDVSNMELKLHKLDKSEIRKKIAEWKKKGYDVTLLEEDLKRKV